VLDPIVSEYWKEGDENGGESFGLFVGKHEEAVGSPASFRVRPSLLSQIKT
jgi:hypothetical protein